MSNKNPPSDFLDKIDSGVLVISSRVNQRALVVAAALLPAVIAFVLPLVFWGETIFSFSPNSSDEVTYWREINTFVDYGFGGGQYSNDELPARFAGSPFGTHGPAFAVIYGSLGKLFGWQEYSPVVIHLVLTSAAIFAAIRIARPRPAQTLLMLMLLATWWPLQLYIPSNMQEVLHSASALVLAALFYRLFARKEKTRWIPWSISFLLIFLVPLRFIWAFLMLPLLLFLPKHVTLKSGAIALLGTFGLLAVGAVFVRMFYSPSPWFWTSLIETFQVNLRTGLREFLRHFYESVESFLALNQGLPLVILLRYQVLGLMLAWTVRLIRFIRTKPRKSNDEGREIAFHIFNLGSVLAFVLFFYDVLDTRDYRMLSFPLLLSVMLLIFSNQRMYVYPVILLNLIFLGSFLTYYSDYRITNFNTDEQIVQQIDESINSNLRFQGGADRWCNTISISKYGRYNAFSYPLTAIHSGFGTTTILEWRQFRDRPLHAKYILLDPNYAEPSFGYPVNHYDLVEISKSAIGTLYLNPNSACDS